MEDDWGKKCPQEEFARVKASVGTRATQGHLEACMARMGWG